MQEHQLNNFYQKYYKVAMKVAFNKVKDYHMAQDIVQEVFLKLFLNGDKLEADVIKPWILVVTDHTAVDYLRKYCKQNTYSLMETDMDTECSLEILIMEDEQNLAYDCMTLKRKIFRELKKKNPVWYEMIRSLYVSNEEPERVAGRMGISLPHLRTTLSRARNWIRREYGQAYRELGL